MSKRAETDDGARMRADLESFLNEHLNDGSPGWPRLHHHQQAKPDDATLSVMGRLRMKIVGDMLTIGACYAVLTIRRLSSPRGSTLRPCSDELDAA